jgi:nickel-type superoxide dismutase maturation protease
MGREQNHHTHITPFGRVAEVPWGLALAALTAAVAAGAARRHKPLRRVRVAGESMRPAFEPGDRLLVGPAVGVRPGAVVAVTDPRSPGQLMVKRVRSLDRNRVDVRGDNESASTDSRQFGPLPRSQLQGRVLYRYGPAHRTGWWPGRTR